MGDRRPSRLTRDPMEPSSTYALSTDMLRGRLGESQRSPSAGEADLPILWIETPGGEVARPLRSA